MIQNIKVDIVYFMTATDFEFEFNLGGCCHMRLLNDKAQDKKSFVNSLARAVSRSQIIICVGPIFGEEGLIATTASAISRGLKTIDNNDYGISSEGEIKIIDGAVPLVTPEGYFGGCIIESGKQTIILLTENRTIRKSIMKNLIHPYIEDVSLMQSAGNAQPFRMDNIARANKPDLSNEDSDEKVQESDETEEDSVITEGEETREAENEDTEQEEILPENADGDAPDDAFDEPQTAEDTLNEEIEHNMEFDFSDEEALVDTNIEQSEFENHNELTPNNQYYDGDRKGKGINISILIVTIILLIAVIGLCYFFVFLPMQNGVSTTDYIRRLFDTASSTSSL